MTYLLIGIALQLLGGSLFGLGMLGSSDSAHIASAAKTHWSSRIDSFSYQIPRLFDADMSLSTVAFHFGSSLILTTLAYLIAFLLTAFSWITAPLSFNVLGIAMAVALILELRTTRNADDLNFSLMHPLFGFVPKLIAGPFLAGLLVPLAPTQKLLASVVLMLALYVAYFITVALAWVISKYVRVLSVVTGAVLYTLGTLVAQS